MSYPPFGSSTNRGMDKQTWNGGHFKEAKEYERNNRWMDLLTQEDLLFINHHLDDIVLKFFGIEKVPRLY